MNEQLNLISIIDILLRRWTVILLSAVLVGAFAFVYSEVFIPPVYSSTASLYVNSNKQNNSEDVSSATLASSRQLVMTYAEILKSKTFLEVIVSELDGKYTISQIKGMLSIESLNDTEIMSITVKGTNAEDVYRIAKSIIKYAPDELIRVVEAGSVKKLDDASETKAPISPNIRNNTFIGVFIGILLGSLIIIILELFDTRIKNGDEISRRYKEPLLGEIPSLMSRGNSYSSGYSSYGYRDEKRGRK